MGTISPRAAEATARATRSSASSAVVPATPIRPSTSTRRLTPVSSVAAHDLRRPDSNVTDVRSARRQRASPVAARARTSSIARSITRGGDVAADQRLFDADVRRPFRHRQGELPTLAAAAAHLVPAEVPGKALDAVQRLEQTPREHHVLHELRHRPVADHVPVGGGEREVLEQRLPAERRAGVDAQLDVPDEVVEGPRSVPDVGVGHAHDRGVAERHRPGVAGGALAQGRGRLARMEPPHEDPVTDERRVLGGRALVVVGERPAQPRRGAVVSHVEHRAAEAAPQRHHLARLRVLVDEIRFGEVAEGFVDEDPGQLVVEDDGIGSALHGRRIEQGGGPAGGLAEARGLPLRAVPAPPQPDRLQSLLDGAVAARDGRARQRDLRAQLVQRGTLGIGEPVLGHFVAVDRLRVHDPRHGQHLAVVAFDQSLLLGERHAAHVAVQVEQRLGRDRRHRREPDRPVEPHRAGQLGRAPHHCRQLVERGEGGDAPAAALVQRAHEPAPVFTGGGGFQARAPEAHGGAPGVFDADFGVVGAGRLERRGEAVLHSPRARSFSA